MIQREDRDSVAVLQMARGKGNSMNIEFLNALTAALKEAEISDAPSAVLTGQGNVFCAGVDLQAIITGDRQYQDNFLQTLAQFLKAVIDFPKPLVAAVNGAAIAGGCIGALACDYRIGAAGSARLGLTELLVGVPFPTWALEVARQAIPRRYFREVCYTGRIYQDEEAVVRGLIDEFVESDDLLDRACEVARQMGEIPQPTFQLTKRQLRGPLIQRAEQQAPTDDPEVIRIWTAEDTLGRIAEFIEKTIKRKA